MSKKSDDSTAEAVITGAAIGGAAAYVTHTAVDMHLESTACRLVADHVITDHSRSYYSGDIFWHFKSGNLKAVAEEIGKPLESLPIGSFTKMICKTPGRLSTLTAGAAMIGMGAGFAAYKIHAKNPALDETNSFVSREQDRRSKSSEQEAQEAFFNPINAHAILR